MARLLLLLFVFVILLQCSASNEANSLIPVACRLQFSSSLNSDSFQCKTQLTKLDNQQQDQSVTPCDEVNYNIMRIVAIGDIHGSYDSFLKILYFANITGNVIVFCF